MGYETMPVPRHIQALVHDNAENFPVASWLLPAHAREGILHFYAFARNADDIADDPYLAPEEKHAQLEKLRTGLGAGNRHMTPQWAHAYMDEIDADRTRQQHGLDLLSAFRQDIDKRRYATFEELLDYCTRSAVPVGRTVLELCNETHADLPAADALCTALQLLNHLRDAGEDFRELDRIYLPQAWLQEHGADEEDLADDITSPAMKATFTTYLNACAELLEQAAPLPHSITDFRLRLELALTIELAHALHKQLRKRDPLAAKIRIPAWQWPYHLIRGVLRLW